MAFVAELVRTNRYPSRVEVKAGPESIQESIQRAASAAAAAPAPQEQQQQAPGAPSASAPAPSASAAQIPGGKALLKSPKRSSSRPMRCNHCTDDLQETSQTCRSRRRPQQEVGTEEPPPPPPSTGTAWEVPLGLGRGDYRKSVPNFFNPSKLANFVAF